LRLIYFHGFRSSPQSFKARLLHEACLHHALDWECPQLPASPRQAIQGIEREISPQPGDCLIGSSLGGYYAAHLGERFSCRVILLNPAVFPGRDLSPLVGHHTMFHSDEPFEFKAEYIDELAALKVSALTHLERYLLVAAKGDELISWRDMVEHYPTPHRIVLEGSDHGLSDFATILPEVLSFALRST
jgi:uncharacterized protein